MILFTDAMCEFSLSLQLHNILGIDPGEFLCSVLYVIYLYSALQCQGGNDLWFLMYSCICSLGNIFSRRESLLNMVPETSQAKHDIIS